MAHRRVIAYATVETLKELSYLLAERGERAKQPPSCRGIRITLSALNVRRWGNNGAAM
jgi:hypothetical protein